MPHTINYTAESDGVDDATAATVLQTVISWESNSAANHFDGIAYDRVNDGMRISVRVTGVTDIGAALTTLDNGISNVNTDEGTSFPAASDTATIQPEG